jgi:hypothetical protein
MPNPWRLATNVTLLQGRTTTMTWIYPHVNPFSGATEGDYKGPQIGVAVASQFSTISGRVNTVNQGCDHATSGGIHYYADLTCVSGGSGTFDFWVQPFQ